MKYLRRGSGGGGEHKRIVCGGQHRSNGHISRYMQSILKNIGINLEIVQTDNVRVCVCVCENAVGDFRALMCSNDWL